MKIAYNKQTWKGFFTYSDSFETIEQLIEVSFKMELTFNENSFIGIASDSESEHLFDKPITVTGFIDEEKISFVKNYPYSYYKDDNGKIILDKESKHPEIHYLGFFDENKKYISGTWEMVVYEEKQLDDYIEEVVTGQFEMRRVLF